MALNPLPDGMAADQVVASWRHQHGEVCTEIHLKIRGLKPVQPPRPPPPGPCLGRGDFCALSLRQRLAVRNPPPET